MIEKFNYFAFAREWKKRIFEKGRNIIRLLVKKENKYVCLENEWLKKENIVDVNATHVKSSGEIFSKTDMKGWVEIKDGFRKLISEKKKNY